ncbi:radical SAM family heme chaperone HemW [Gammaproteobacteria bacterium]|jgi:putative oxygen-independent coproporphyrinogen III oxidase|nr:radical SAM family heme chaperone HemW [Gammaproteobacteria bacterium]MDA9867639.1 radical SAM family heme chaperone HemW [Gammaproteobacteria bacterium]MDC1007735.1 radical SAM family heme chaperone HemW [Gammaproteobacteria bacterium]
MSLKKFTPNKIPISLYIHLPWCEKKCPYCDFNISINRSQGDEYRLMNAIFYDLKLSRKYINKRKFSSIYFGGGTPSLVSSRIIDSIINKLREMQVVQEDCEINFELNPKEVTKDYLTKIIDSGINRVSLGIQSFDQSTLNSLERNHTSQDSLQALEVLSGFKDIETSIDLIYGIMDQSLPSFRSDIETFCSYKINHLSLYQLTIEPNTIFYKKELKIPNDAIIESMESTAAEILNKNNIYQYEVSSWSRDNRYSKHNMNYWMYGDYLGVGPGAHSKITTEESIERMVKLKKVDSYIKDPNKSSTTKIDSFSYDLDLAMNLLRIKNGVSFDELKNRNIHITNSFKEKILQGIDRGLLEKNTLKATPKGYKFLNDTANIFS